MKNENNNVFTLLDATIEQEIKFYKITNIRKKNFYLKNCFERNKKSKDLIFLVGDSTAFSLVPTFESSFVNKNFIYFVKDGSIQSPGYTYQYKNRIFIFFGEIKCKI